MRLVRVPNTPEGYLGEVALRGSPLSVVSLRAQLRLPVLWESDHPLLLVAEFNQRITGFLIDEIVGIHRVSWKAFTSFGQVANLGACTSVIGTITIDTRVIQILDLEAMMSKLDTTVSFNGAGVSVDAGSAFDPSTVRLVYAEDSSTIQKITIRMLRRAGFSDIQVFSTGHDALDYIAGVDVGAVDVLLTDIEMPEMDGLTLCRKLRGHAVFNELPIIFYSSMINEQMVLKCTAVGGSICFAKPDLTDLTGIIGAVEALCSPRVALKRCG
ncbi:MAG: two-component system chemotaxis response regulator CheV [Myxococcota bacterium]|jgi:two-component system chemotaxis response regulator CheV